MSAVLIAGGVCSAQPVEIGEFRPFDEPGYSHTNAHEVSPDGQTLYLALFPERVAAAKGVEAPPDAPEVSIYVSTRQGGGGWSAPEPISFAGPHKDYEQTLSPDGRVMLFNSWRPMPDGTPTNEKNNLWISRQDDGGRWSEPALLEGASKLETEESYPTIAPDGRVYYGQGTLDAAGETESFDVFTGVLDGNRLTAIEPFAPAATSAGEGDPWVSRDGNVLVFTRWVADGDWYDTVDLYVTFRENGRWSEPVPFPFNDDSGPDFSPGGSADGETFYWKRSDGTKSIPMTALMEARL